VKGKVDGVYKPKSLSKHRNKTRKNKEKDENVKQNSFWAMRFSLSKVDQELIQKHTVA
jgi:hypothetical protein